MGGPGSGRRIEHHDKYHEMWRKNQRRYTEKNREVLRLAGRLRIPVAEARKRLKEQKRKRGTEK